MTISGTTGFGIAADTVASLLLDGVLIDNINAPSVQDRVRVVTSGDLSLIDVDIFGGGSSGQGVRAVLPSGANSSVLISGLSVSDLTGRGIGVDVAGTAAALIDGNDVSNVREGIMIGGSGTIDATIVVNNVASEIAAIHVQAAEAGTVCLSVEGNSAVGSPGIGVDRTTQTAALPTFRIERLNNGTGVVTTEADVVTHIARENANISSASATSVTPVAFEGVPDGTCRLPG